MLLSNASVDYMKTITEIYMSPLRFRPNIVVDRYSIKINLMQFVYSLKSEYYRQFQSITIFAYFDYSSSNETHCKPMEAFDEDKYGYIKVGASAIFRNVYPCSR